MIELEVLSFLRGREVALFFKEKALAFDEACDLVMVFVKWCKREMK